MNRIAALYRLLLRQQLTTGRLVLVGGFSALALAAAFALSRSAQDSSFERVEAATFFVHLFGLGLMVPIVSLVLASSSLSDLVEDETIVYLWHRPAPRWMLALAAWGASFTVAGPLTVIPLTAAGALASGADATVVSATALTSAIAVLAYSGLFTLGGLMLRRALIWGLLYVFIWEQFVARVGGGASRLSIFSYPSSVLERMTDVDLGMPEQWSMGAGLIVPIVVGLTAIALTSWRLNHIDVA